MTEPPAEPRDREVGLESWSDTQVDGPAGSDDPGVVSIAGYRFEGKIHQGGQGVVYRALQISTNRQVAIKVLREGPYASPEARKRFQREVEIVAQLKHPGIVQIFDSGRTREGFPFYVMEFVAGRELDGFVTETRPSLDETLAIFLEVLDAVAHAHDQGVIHRDLKSPNVLVEDTGHAKVLDFGLARAEVTPVDSVLSMTGQFLGTVATMSPEQVRGKPDEVGPRADVYALGVMLYRVVTGSYPYPVQGQLMEVLRHITETEPARPRRAWSPHTGIIRGTRNVRPRSDRCPIDDDLETVLLKAIAKEPERRYDSVSAFAGDLRRFREGRPIEAKRDSAMYVMRKRLRRNRGRTVTLVGAIALVAVTVYALAFREPARPSIDPATLARFTEAEAEYFEVKDELMGVLDTRGAEGDPMATVTEESLRILEDAVAELRAAIEKDPDNLELRELLIGTYQKELNLLRRISALPSAGDGASG